MSLHEVNLIKRPGIEVEPGLELARSLARCTLPFVLSTEVVVGVEAPNEPTVVANGYTVTGTESEQSFSLRDTAAFMEFYQRMYGSDVSFFENTYGVVAGRYQDCHAMVRAVLGIEYAEGGLQGYPEGAKYPSTNIDALKPYTPYVGLIRRFNRLGEEYKLAAHGMMTTDSPEQVLNVLGVAGTMVVADADVISNYYFGPESRRIPLEGRETLYEVVLPATLA